MKTKTIAILLLIVTLWSCKQQSHRLEYLKTIEIPTIQVIISQPDGNTSFMKINDEAEIKKIMDFLFQTRFEPYSSESPLAQSLQDKWRVKLVFEGQQDQIFLFEDHAFIGKSIYFIDNDVLNDFLELTLKLKS
jgi:hypothetical protein